MKKIFIYIFFGLFLNSNTIENCLSNEFLNKYLITIDYEMIDDLLNSSVNEKKEKIENLEIFFKEKLLAINDKNTVENLKIKEILQKIQQAFIDNKAAQVNYSIDEILKNNFLENNDLKKERLKTAFICETIDANYSEFNNELEKVVNARIKFIEFLLKETDESKKFLDFVIKRLKKINEIEIKINKVKDKIKVKILSLEEIFEQGKAHPLIASKFLRDNIFLNINPVSTTCWNLYFGYLFKKSLSSGAFKNINLKNLKDSLNKLTFSEKAKTFLGISLISASLIYSNYILIQDKYLTPKYFEDYGNLIKEKNEIIIEIYEEFKKLSKKIVELNFIPEKELIDLVLNSDKCKIIENKFYFNKLNRLISLINNSKIFNFYEKLKEELNFDITKESIPNKIFPFTIYEKFLGFIEFSIFKAKLVKNSKKNNCSTNSSIDGEILERNDNNIFSIPKFNQKINNLNLLNVWHPGFSNFISNDIDLDENNNKIERNALIIAPTGTGKSTFLMQLLSLLILSRIGIVPAEFAELRFPSKIFQNLISINGEIGSGMSKHMEERRFVNEINKYGEKNKDLYIYVVADEICSGTTRSQTEEFAKSLLSKAFDLSNISMILTTHIEEIFSNVSMANTVLFNIEVIRNGPVDFTLTRKLKRGAGFWMDPKNKNIQNEFVLYLQKLEDNKNLN